MDSYFPRRKSKNIEELNIVPILDMFVSVIFFLLLSTSFLALTKNTVPPSATVTSATPDKIPPVSPKIFFKKTADKYVLSLQWRGVKPGKKKIQRSHEVVTEEPEEFLKELREMIQKWAVDFPKEKTVQLSLSRNVEYENLILLMDAVRQTLPDIVLVSYDESDAPSKDEE